MSLRTRVIAALAGATMLGGAITEVVQHNEGLSLTAYKDSAGIPTICYGETKGVKMGQRATLSDCQKQLIESAGEHAKALDGLPMQLSDVALIGSVDFIYNVGVAGFNGSAVKRHLKHLDYTAAGKAVLNWRYISKYQQKSRALVGCTREATAGPLTALSILMGSAIKCAGAYGSADNGKARLLGINTTM